MDFDNTQDPNHIDPPQPSQAPPVSNIPNYSAAAYEPNPKKKKGSGWKIFFSIVLVLSILANGFMLLAMVGMGVMVAGSNVSADNSLIETTLVDGPRTNKIAVISLEGVINGEMSAWVQQQLKRAEDDSRVRAVIVNIVSPGGGVAASDQIHYYISRFKEHTNKPVLAFMQSIAASGGYYSAVACDEIMAEPTVITGSIGVIMNHLVIKDLLTEKLGIDPVTLKSGEYKDWPSMFNETTEEEKQYLMERVVTPAYDRFVELVTEGRKDVLDAETVRQLADGSIYTAQQAVDNQLIDGIGYFDDAIYKAQQMAGISDAKVISYSPPVTFRSMMGLQGKSPINIETEILEKLAAPRILYLWDGKR
ncbi:MAG: signal peptide peptidase SppA [Planctomycetota bacterium]|jgi:protease-4